MTKLILLAVAGLVVACGSRSVSPPVMPSSPSFTASYEAFSCDQLYSEARRITVQMRDIAGVRDADVEMERLEFVGGVLYWPILLLVDGSSDSKAAQAEYDQLESRLLNLSAWVVKAECGN